MNKNKNIQISVEEKIRLGLYRPISRRDFINGMLVGAVSLMLPGCSGLTPDSNEPPDSASLPGNLYSGGNTDAARFVCHRVRDGQHFSRGAEDTGELYDLVVVGAGLGGLTAAFFYNQERPEEKILLLDNHSDFGGDAQRNELTVKGQNIIVTQGGDYQWGIEGIAINRWGHAEITCYPRFAFGSGSSDEPVPGVPIYDARQRFGRIAFAHTDLNGFADNQGTTMVSRRAVNDLLD